jgi:hypothetical protein
MPPAGGRETQHYKSKSTPQRHGVTEKNKRLNCCFAVAAIQERLVQNFKDDAITRKTTVQYFVFLRVSVSPWCAFGFGCGFVALSPGWVPAV